MQSCLYGRLSAMWLGAAAVMGLSIMATWSRAAAQPGANTLNHAEKDLEPAAAKARDGKIDEVLALIKEQAAKHPEWPPSRLILARLLFGINQAVPGRQALEQAVVELPDNPEVYLNLGGIALGDGRFSDARLNFDHVLSLLNSGRANAEKTKLLRREVFAGLASVAEGRADWKTTQEQLNAWLKLDPKNGRVRQRLGRALFQLGKKEDAFATLTQATKDEPTLEPAAISMALLNSQKGDFTKAEEWFDYARKHDPKNPRVWLAHGAWLVERGQTARARAEVDEALKLDPSSHEAKKIRALVSWHSRELAAAEAALEPLHRDAPADSFVANLLALALIEQDDAAKQSRGLQLADINVLQFPRSPEVAATLGWGLYRAGRLDQAEKKLHAAVTGGRTTADIAYFLARLMADKGQNDAARRILQEATSTKGAFAHREDANALLKKLAK